MPTNERYWSELEAKCRRGRYLVVQCSSVGVPYESTLERGLGGNREGLTHAQDVAGGMSKLLERGWRYVGTIGGSADLMVFERVEWPLDDPLGRYPAVLDALKSMHRRAQANEGAAIRERRLRDGFAKERATLIANTRFWEKKFQERCERAENDAKAFAQYTREVEYDRCTAIAAKSTWQRFLSWSGIRGSWKDGNR